MSDKDQAPRSETGPEHHSTITARLRQSEATLADALELLQAISDASPGGIVAYQADGPCVFANAAAGRIIGATRSQLIQQNFREIKTWRESGLFMAAEHALKGDGVVEHELQTISSFGTPVCLHCTLTTFQSRGEPHLLLAYEDITGKRTAEQTMTRALDDLERSNLELEQFAYVASHDLQEPLRMVAAFTQLLADRYGDKLDATAREYIHHAVEGATRMRRLINSLLDLSRVHREAQDLVSVNWSSLLDQVKKDLTLKIQESGAVIAARGLPILNGDPPQLRQLLQNLLDNAIKFHGEAPPRAEISAARTDSGWTFQVADNGIGIPEEHRERVFAPFQRLHLRRDYPGDGIGLAIARKVVERHGGRIHVEANEGGGTRVIFDIPDDPGVD